MVATAGGVIRVPPSLPEVGYDLPDENLAAPQETLGGFRKRMGSLANSRPSCIRSRVGHLGGRQMSTAGNLRAGSLSHWSTPGHPRTRLPTDLFTFGESREAPHRAVQLVRGRGSGARQAPLVVQAGPVVGVGDVGT